MNARCVAIARGVLLFCGACLGHELPSSAARPAVEASEQPTSPRAPVASGASPEATPGQDALRFAACLERERVEVFEAGRMTRRLCPAEAKASGLAVIDLSDDWAPFVFSEAPELGAHGEQPYRETFLALADERTVADGGGVERYLELYGIFPTLRVLRDRMADESRHRCNDAIDRQALAQLGVSRRGTGPSSRELDRRRVAELQWLSQRLERARLERGVSSVDALLDDPELGPLVARRRRVAAPVQAVQALQARLGCEGLLEAKSFEDGVLDWPTVTALRTWQRKHMLISRGRLDPPTVELLALPSRELTYRSLLRALRERVVDALGWIEDGSAATGSRTIFGRQIDPPELHVVEKYGPLQAAAPDLISSATEAAARALGFTSPEATRVALRRLPASGAITWNVALMLPAAPRWQSSSMSLHAELDRGDVWYAFPYKPDGSRRRMSVPRRPTITLFVEHDGRRIPLMRWHTTIGGWKPEVAPSGRLGLRYKESPVGRRLWRHLIASPAWLPPSSTPDGELVRRAADGSMIADTQTTLPGFRSAYGLVMLVHHKPLEPPSDEDESPARFFDEGVRTHGSVSYESILEGTSHGCHRLFNHLAIRLTGFLLRHRPFIRVGAQSTRYTRTIRYRAQRLQLRIDTRGYLYELDPPVPIEVLRGQIRGPVQKPIEGLLPLPAKLGMTDEEFPPTRTTLAEHR